LAANFQKHKGWSLTYAQYLELQPGSQWGHQITEVVFFVITGWQNSKTT